MKTWEQYTNEIHKLGRICIVITLIVLFGLPIIYCTIYDIIPSFSEFILAASGLLFIFIPIGIAEVFSYTPILGSAAYVTFITGNILNLKLPCATNAMSIADVSPGTEKADIVGTLAISISSITTVIVIFIGVLLLVPLEPIMSTPAIKTATTYLIPALFGALIVSILSSSGDVIIEGVWKAGILPGILILCVNLFVISLSGLEGVALLVVIPLTILCAKVLYKKDKIKVIYKGKIQETKQ